MFLKQIAQYYKDTSDLPKYCFVFPNRRSGQFFMKELSTTRGGVTLMPEVTTISDFISHITHQVVATPVEALYLLHKSYCECTGKDDYPFDHFVFWGNIILNDFNDVDMYCVNPDELFSNEENFHEISTDFLSPELKDIISRYFNVRLEENDDERFWKNYKPESDEDTVKRKFYDLWLVLPQLYHCFEKNLRDAGLTYKGKMYREAVDIINDTAPDDFDRKHYVFVGFNMLSMAEMRIFKAMRDKRIADFFWDYNSPFFDEKTNKCTTLLNYYVKEFRSPDDFDMPKNTLFPANIQVIGVPSMTGQVKYAFEVLNEWKKSGYTNADNAIDTAIVLPDEQLFVPLVNSIDPAFTSINVTLGYQLRSSDIASLMRMVAKMHSRASKRAARNGEPEFQYLLDDVKDVLSHPIVKSFFLDDVAAVTSHIDNENLYTVPENVFAEKAFSGIFRTIEQHDSVKAVTSYLDNLISFCNLVEKLIGENQQGETNARVLPLQCAFIEQYTLVLEHIKQLVEQYNIPLCDNNALFYLIDRLAALYSIPFEGEPLTGLQIMGMLETRCLDFKNVIIISANERVFPRKSLNRSFISDFIREHHMMSTIIHQEAISTYYFYRLLSHATNVAIIYDTSSQAVGSGEPSRFISQLEMVYSLPLRRIEVKSEPAPANEIIINVEKDERIKKAIDAYLTPKSGRYLSATSINELIDCPLKFYIRHIERINEDEDSEFMDARTFGTIVHDSLQELYYPEGTKGSYRVSRLEIAEFRKKLEKVVMRNINRVHLHRKPEEYDEPLKGEAVILLDALKTYTDAALKHDLGVLKNDDDFFEVLECEIPHELTLDLGGTPFNFKFKADRIDRINGTGPVRIIDYKTGKDLTSFSNIDQLFNPDTKDRRHAILQLFLYCNAYAQLNEGIGPIEPHIYKLRDMAGEGVKVMITKKDSEQIADFENYTFPNSTEVINESFKESMNQTIANLKSPKSSFTQTSANEKIAPCRYCKFAEFCRR